MAKVMTSVQFRDIAKKGTVFCYGPKWSFGKPFIYLEAVDCAGPYWGFWAADPCWPESDDSMDAFDRLDACLASGESFEVETASTKCMSYVDDLDDAVFIVFEEADLRRLVQDWWPKQEAKVMAGESGRSG